MKLTQNRNRLLAVFACLPFKPALVALLNRLRRARLARLATPENLIYFVTSRCNARCGHCFYWRDLNQGAKELALPEIRKLVASLRNRLDTVMVTGGEPLLRGDLYDIIEVFYRLNRVRKIHLTSNGSLPDRLQTLCENILGHMDIELAVQLSLDGDETYHNQLRGAPIYQSVMESLRRLKPLEQRHANFILSAATVLTRDNLCYLEPLARQMEERQIKWGFNLLRSSTYGILNLAPEYIANYSPKDERALLPPLDEIALLAQRYAPARPDLRARLSRAVLENSLQLLRGRPIALKCRAGVVDGVLYANGDVAMCEVTRPFGNVKSTDYDFYRLWTSPSARAARRWIAACSCIHPCHMIDSMKYDYRFLLA